LIDLYSGASLRALEDLESSLGAHRSAELWRIQIVRIDVDYVRACCLLAGLRSGDPADLRKLHAIIERLRGEGVAWATCLSRALRAALDAERGSTGGLMRTAEELEALNMELFAAAARVQAGRLASDADLVAAGLEAEEFLRARGVKEPVRLAGAILPVPAVREARG
jgi:hypothetical protein